MEVGSKKLPTFCLLLQAISEVFAELLHQAVGPITCWLKTSHKEAEDIRLVDKSQTANKVAIVVEPMHTVDNIVDLREGKYSARNSQTEQLYICRNLLTILIASA